MKSRKIVLIGPVYPYKGGIAHYTSLLYRALSQKYDVEMISYKMRYPRFLLRREQKDYRNDVFRIEDAQFLLHTADPFNIIRTASKIRRMHPDLVIIQWWHPYFAPCYRILEAALGRKIRKMFICHNVFPHERFPFDRALTKLVLNKADYFLLHSERDVDDLLAIRPDAQYRLNPHPTYNAFRIRNLTKSQAREELLLPVDEKVLLFFGFVREYKGLKHLIKAMPEVKRRLGNVRLIVAVAFGSDRVSYRRMIDDNGANDCIEVVDRYIADNEVEKYFAACDIAVLPYESATQSGIVQIAFGFGKPVIVTNVGGLPDVVADGQTGYIVERGDPGQLADAIVRFYENDMAERFEAQVRREADRFSWDRLVEKIDEFMGQA